jgi:hypothetical protein
MYSCKNFLKILPNNERNETVEDNLRNRQDRLQNSNKDLIGISETSTRK